MAPAGYGDRVEGFHAVGAAAGRIVELWVDRDRLRRSDYHELVDRIRRSGGRVNEVNDVLEMAESDAPQGLVARCRAIPSSTLEQLVAGDRPASVVVLDHVLDPHNLGAIARSAAAAGLDGLVISTRRAAPLSAVAFKAAAGGLETLKVATVTSIADGLARLQKLGLWAVGLDAGAEQSLFGLPLLTEPVALVVGEEGSGLSRLVADRVDVTVRIPVTSGTESLNVSVAAALAAFEVMRARSR